MRTTELFLSALLALAPLQTPEDEHPALQDQHGTVGSVGEAFTLLGPAGESVSFPDRTSSDLRLTVLVFWATWNDYSERELKRLAELSPRWSTNGVRVVAVNVESSRSGEKELEIVREWLASRELPFPVAIDPNLDAFHAYGVVALPTTIVMDSDGTVVFRLPGYPLAGAERLIDAVQTRVIEETSAEADPTAPVSQESKRAVRHLRLGALLALRGEFDLAEYTFKQSIAEDPRLLDARLSLAALFEQASRPKDERRVLDEAAKDFAEHERFLLASAGAYFRSGDGEQAEFLARTALELNPSFGPALVLLGKLRSAAGDLTGAGELLLEAARINPLDKSALLALAAHHEQLGDKEAAYEWYKKTYQLLDPSWDL